MKELPQSSLAPESFPKRAARFVLKKAIHTLPASVLLFAACSGGSAAEKNNNQELKDKESSGYALPFPEGETWFLTNGPHADGWSNGIRYAIDIAPPELGRLNGNCPIDVSRLSIDNRFVTASASGKITLVGNGQRTDPFHSVVDVKGKNGLTQRFIHVDPILVKLGDKVQQGDRLGNPSCEYPPGGANTGPHVHVGLIKDGQAIPIDGTVIGGWTIHENGTMTKPGEKTRAAGVGRSGEDYRGIRNDLPNNPNRAVVALPKDPIPPISGQATSKEVFTAPPPPTPTAIPTPKPTETPKPVLVEKEPKSLEEQAKLLALNNFLDLLSSTQVGKGVHDSGNNPTYILESKIEQDMRASKADIIQGRQSQDSDRLLVRWNNSVLTEGRARKNLGEAEIKGLQMQVASQPITRAEQANGIQWKGKVQINYLTHWRFVLPFFAGGGYAGTKREWTIANPQIPSNLSFSPWTEKQWPDTLILANGRWTFSNAQPANQTDRVLYPLQDVYSVTDYSRDSNPCNSSFGGRIPGCLELQLGPRPDPQVFESYRLPYKLLRRQASWELNSLHGGELEGAKYDSFTVDKPDLPHKFFGFASISQKRIHPDATLESQTEEDIIKMMDLNLNSVGKKRVNLTFSQAIIKITDRNVAGINARTILTIAHTWEPPVYQSYRTFLIVKDADGSRKLWIIDFTYPHKDVSSDQAERINNQLLEGFELLPKSP